jgi:hypothetical protein
MRPLQLRIKFNSVVSVEYSLVIPLSGPVWCHLASWTGGDPSYKSFIQIHFILTWDIRECCIQPVLVSPGSSFRSCNGSMLICQMVPEGNPLHILVQLRTSSIHGRLFIQPPMANMATVSKIPHANSCPTCGHHALAKWLTSSLISVLLCLGTHGDC